MHSRLCASPSACHSNCLPMQHQKGLAAVSDCMHHQPCPTAAAHPHAGPQQICLPQALAKMRCWLQAQPNALGNVITLPVLAAVVEDCRHSPSLI